MQDTEGSVSRAVAGQERNLGITGIQDVLQAVVRAACIEQAIHIAGHLVGEIIRDQAAFPADAKKPVALRKRMSLLDAGNHVHSIGKGHRVGHGYRPPCICESGHSQEMECSPPLPE